MYYYTIEIPRHADGKIATYPPNWFGVMAKCPKNVTVEIFNDKDGWLLAQVDDTFIPPEVSVISEAEALDLMAKTKTDKPNGIYASRTAITERWTDLEAARLQEIADEEARQQAIEDAKYDTSIEAVLNG